MNRTIDYTIKEIQTLIDEQLEPADRLPSEKELVETLGVSRSTVRDALSRLAAKGIVERQWGVGTFVTDYKSRTAFGILRIRPGIPGLLATTGGTPSVYSFDFTRVPPDPVMFPDFPDRPILSTKRVFALDGVPAIALRDLLVCEFKGGRIDPSPLRSVDVLVADAFDKVGIDFARIEIEIWAADLDKEGQSIFDLSRPEPVIETHGRGFDADGRHIMTVRGIYRTRIVKLNLTVS